MIFPREKTVFSKFFFPSAPVMVRGATWVLGFCCLSCGSRKSEDEAVLAQQQAAAQSSNSTGNSSSSSTSSASSPATTSDTSTSTTPSTSSVQLAMGDFSLAQSVAATSNCSSQLQENSVLLDPSSSTNNTTINQYIGRVGTASECSSKGKPTLHIQSSSAFDSDPSLGCTFVQPSSDNIICQGSGVTFGPNGEVVVQLQSANATQPLTNVTISANYE